MQRPFSKPAAGIALLALVVGCTESGTSGTGGVGGAGASGGGGSGGTAGASATLYLDQYGIPHADCATDEDCAMVLGYQHAFDRFAQMDLRRRLPTGRLADLFDKDVAQFFGVPAIAVENRALFSTREGRPVEDVMLEHVSEKTLGLLEAYSAGVNQWIKEMQNGENGATFPRELANPPLSYDPANVPQWTPRDSLAITLALVENLTNFEATEVAAGAAREAIDNDAKFFDLWNVHPVIESSILPPGWQPPNTGDKSLAETVRGTIPDRSRLRGGTALRSLRDRLERHAALRRRLFASGDTATLGGSNNWVVAPSKTRDGNALLANDPHLMLSQPSVWYLAHLDAKTHGSGEIHAAGATLAGLPMVILGQNESIAWGATNTYIDYTDVYLEELVKDEEDTPVGVVFRDETVPFLRVPFAVRFNDGTEEEREMLFVPHHGPVREIDLENDVAITLRWTLQEATTEINMFTELDRASTVEEARVGLENSTTAGQCWVVADRDGNIGYFPYNRPPKRPWATNLEGGAPPWVPIDGRGDYEWVDFWEHAELPQVVNPESGFVATANNDITGHLFDGDPTNDGYPLLQTTVHSGFRHSRIVDMIEDGGDQHTTETMMRIQRDTRLIAAEKMLPRLLELASSEAVTLSERAKQVRDVLEDWNLTCPTGLDGPYMNSPLSPDAEERTEAVGCSAFHAVLFWCGSTILRRENARADPSAAYYYTLVDPTKLAAGDVYWDDPSTPEVETDLEGIEECFDKAASVLIEDRGLGEDETQWVWGRAQGLQLFSDLASFEIHDFDNPPPGGVLFANDGGFHSVDPNNPGFDWTQTAGASARFVCEVFPDGPQCSIQLPGGQSGDVDSENYEDLLFKWLENESIELVFDIEKAAEQAVRTVTFE